SRDRLIGYGRIWPKRSKTDQALIGSNPRFLGGFVSTATGIRTPVSAMRGRRPSPLDDSGALGTGIDASRAASRKRLRGRARTPVPQKADSAGVPEPVPRPRRPPRASAVPRCDIFACPRGCGGIGRRARFRSVSGKPGGGSSPLIRIELFEEQAPLVR